MTATLPGAEPAYAFVPTREQVDAARVTHFMARLGVASIDELRERSAADPEWYWAAVVDDLAIPFEQPPVTILGDADGPAWARWFEGGTINVAAACVDRWADDPETADQPAVLAEDERGDLQTLTFRALRAEVDRAAGGLRELGVARGDTVGLLLPMTPEAVIATYAVAKLGAIVVPIFSGHAAEAVADRLRDAGCRVVVCADGTWRKGRLHRILDTVDEAVRSCPDVDSVVVVERIGAERPPGSEREVLWSALTSGRPAQRLEALRTASEDPFLLAYTSGTTGAPKGAVHVHGGFLVKVASEAAYSMDVGRDDRLLWVTDMGWIMGVWSMIGAHALGAALVMLDAAPDHPDPSRLWQVVARHGVTHLGLSPTLVRALRASGDDHVLGRDLSSLRILGSTGEPWTAEPYIWLMDVTGGGRPIINLSGGTEVGACLLAAYPVEPLKPCSLGGPSLGMAVDVVDSRGRPVRGTVGELVCTKPWPGMTRGIWRNPERYVESYWSTYDGMWRHGDWALVDGDGEWFVLGRSDDVINVAGKRVAPAEVESVLAADAAVSDVVVLGVPDPLKGAALWCFWTPAAGSRSDHSDRLADRVADALGRPFRPRRVVCVDDIPRTRSGKPLRRALAAAVADADAGDLSTAENPDAVERIRRQLHGQPGHRTHRKPALGPVIE